MSSPINIKKDYIWNTIGTSANSFISLALLIIVTRINGLGEYGEWSFNFGYAITFFTIGLYGGRIYQISDVAGEFESRTYIYLKFITSAAMFITAVVFILVNGYSWDRAILMLSLVIYKILDAIADPLYGIMQRRGYLYHAGISMTIKAALGLIFFIIVDLLTKNMFLSSLCLLAANAVFIVIYDIPHVKRLETIGNVFSGNLRPSLILLKASVFICAFALFANLLTNIPRYFVDASHSEEILGRFGIVIMPATLVNLFVTFIIQPKLVSLSERHAAGAHVSFDKTVTKFILISLAFGLIATAAIWLIGAPVLSFILGQDLYENRMDLTLAVLAGTIYSVTMIYSNILSIMRKFGIQLVNYLIGMAVLFATSILLIPNSYIHGAVMAFLLANIVLAILFFVSYQVIIRKLRQIDMPQRDPN